MNIHRRRSREIGKKFGGLRHFLCYGSVYVFMQRPDKLQQSSIKTFNGIDHSLACAQNIHNLCSVLLKLKKVLMKSSKYLIPPRCFIPSLRSMGV
jgi:hypothetical protein